MAVGLGAIGTGCGLGGAMMTIVQIVVNLARSHLEAAAYQQAIPNPLLSGTVASLVLAAFFGWRRGGPIENVWQRGVIAVLAAFGTLIVGFLAAVADRLLGLTGLILWCVVALSFGIAASRWATRAAGAVPGGADGAA